MNLRIPTSHQLRLRSARGGRLLIKSPWVCPSCKISSSSRWASASTPPAPAPSSSKPAIEKPYYVTTPIFYVNAAPHVGHLYSMVLADVFKRWQLLRRKRAFLCTGTDEHGMKVQQAAAHADMAPKEFCDLTSVTFKNLAERIGLANDYFVRTTDQSHKDAVQYAWFMLEKAGYIYQSKHEGWYCVSDETYYPESAIEKRLDPYTGKTFMASQETGKEVEWTSEPNYHFKLSAFKNRLLKFYKSNPQFVVPATRMKDVVNWVSAGLEDLSISRPVERLSWGIPVPGDETQTIYVWLDALINYATKAGYPWAPGKEQELGWPADLHVIGKDIVRFHCIYWPAFLIALGLEPPKRILAHAHWTLGKQKMAKSTGNVVSPALAMDRFGVDAIRYYLVHDGGITNDSDYGNHHIVERYKKGLQGGLGNLASRITRPKTWNVRKCIEAIRDRGLLSSTRNQTNQAKYLAVLSKRASAKMGEFNAAAALHLIMDTVYETNRILQDVSPWILGRSQDFVTRPDTGVVYDANQQRIEEIVYHCAESLRITGILLQPFIPTKAEYLLDMLGVEKDRRFLKDAVYGKDFDYGTPMPGRGPGRKPEGALFPPLSVWT
ncbi:hypothetical protein HYFRA_00000282 [Hymenoscyphus fraxineus]|uniref:Probable methionine--tRNA ligase, mitochondrial n=1 Tax=Hymenoscyphus fraxineus TaxID=746836 RepID=A0A9N9L0K7_9HELO|nr:hypothetical protein HYFRA_00000282 [Hymenoscyphus fraxineus]